MNLAAETLRRGARRVILFQALLTLLVAAVFAYVHGWQGFLPAMYGGGVAALSTGWLARGVRRAEGLGALYANAVTRYAAAILFLGLGVGMLKLLPLPLILGFTVAQFGFLVSARGA